MTKLKAAGVTYSLIALFISVLMISIVFPTYSIFGYNHSVLSSTDPDLYVTMTPMPLFNVISDGFYSLSLKTGYLLLFSFQIVSIIVSLLLLPSVVLDLRKSHFVLALISFCSLLIEEILVCSFFYSNILVLSISVLCVCLTVVTACLYLISDSKLRKKN